MDFGAETLSVKRILSGAEGGRPVFGTPKTAKSRRSVKLTAPAVEPCCAIGRPKTENGPRRGPGGKTTASCSGPRRVPPLNRHNLVRRSFKPLLEKAGLPSIRFHDLRHTCATILLSKGKHPKYVQALLGHATVAITLDTYSHVLPGMDVGLAEAMEDALS